MSTASTIWVISLLLLWGLSARWVFARSDCRRVYRWLDALSYPPLGLLAIWLGLRLTQGVLPGVSAGLDSLPALNELGGAGRQALSGALALLLSGLPVALGFWGWRQLLISKS